MDAAAQPTAAETVKALRHLADLMETETGWMGLKTPIHLDDLLYMRACYGYLLYWDATTGHYQFHRDHWKVPAKRYAAEALVSAVCRALGAWDPNNPDRHSPTRFTVAQVRAAADRIDA